MSQLQIIVDRELCLGAQNCKHIAPDVFEIDDEGLAQLEHAIRTNTLKSDDTNLLRFFYARADRQCTLLRPAMGALADGHFSPID